MATDRTISCQIRVDYRGENMTINDAFERIAKQLDEVAAASAISGIQMQALVDAIGQVSAQTCCSAEEAGNALRQMLINLYQSRDDLYSLVDYSHNEIEALKTARAETNARIENLELKTPFQIFDTEFEVDGVPMKAMMSPEHPECLYLMPEQKEKPIKLVYENENINDWYDNFINNLNKSFN